MIQELNERVRIQMRELAKLKTNGVKLGKGKKNAFFLRRVTQRLRTLGYYLSVRIARSEPSTVRFLYLLSMAGIYLHIPFCKQACHYCDFHFSTNTQRRGAIVEAMVHELGLQQNYLGGDEIRTIYLGGGTPSLLTESELGELLEAIDYCFTVVTSPEITLEANPDDLTYDKLSALQKAGINRLSIGIQSFHEPHLRYLNRAHTASEATRCVQQARDIGFDNISIDLIYAIPAEDHRIWHRDLEQAVALQPQHISAYCLTIEEKTAFGRWQRQGRLRAVSDEAAAEQFENLLSTLTAAGYDPYEVSNFCQPGKYSQHNTSYWQGEKYLGIGPSAHSYDGTSRQYNVAHNAKYLRAIQTEEPAYERETLSRYDRINELIMTGLRTKWGCDLEKLAQHHYPLLEIHTAYVDRLIAEQKATIRHNHLILTNEGKLLADGIAEDLFLINTEQPDER